MVESRGHKKQQKHEKKVPVVGFGYMYMNSEQEKEQDGGADIGDEGQ